MRIVSVAALAVAIAVSAVAPGFAQDSPFKPRFGGGGLQGGGAGPGRGFQGSGPGGGGLGGGGHRFGQGGSPFGDGSHPDGRRFGGGSRPDGRRFGGGQDGGGYRRHGYGAAVGAGVAGLAAGALIGGAIANQGYYGDPAYGYGTPRYVEPDDDSQGPVLAEDDAPPTGDAADYCARRYRSYDPASGTYLGFDGDRHPCP